MNNPYETPAESSVVALKPHDPAKVKLIRLSWLLPLACLGMSIAINVTVKPAGAFGGFIFIGSVLVGFLLSIVGFCLAPRYAGVLGHAIGGLITNVLLGLVIVGCFYAVLQYRDAVRQRGDQTSPHTRMDP